MINATANKRGAGTHLLLSQADINVAGIANDRNNISLSTRAFVPARRLQQSRVDEREDGFTSLFRV
ncbi:MAG: hypothetical protein ABJQ90_00045 [Parasphingorhabdus sp.]